MINDCCKYTYIQKKYVDIKQGYSANKQVLNAAKLRNYKVLLPSSLFLFSKSESFFRKISGIEHTLLTL